MTIEEMIERKYDMGYTYEKVAQLSGLSPETVQDVLDGIIKFPGEDTLKALENVFKESRIKYDSDNHAVTVYKFGDMTDFKIYEVNEDELAVPVGIFDDKFIVDFGEIFEMVSEFEKE